jgi:hypothetical protein
MLVAIRGVSIVGRMHRILVVANQTLGGSDLLAVLGERLAKDECDIYLLVPVHGTRPTTDYPTFRVGPPPSEAATFGAARGRLEAGLERLRALGATVHGGVGGTDPVAAIEEVLARREFDEIIISTLPPGVSRWLRQDLPHKVERKLKRPVTVVTAKLASSP